MKKTKQMINARLDALALARKEREERFIDSLVELDEKEGPLQPLGKAMQSLAAAIYTAQKKLW